MKDHKSKNEPGDKLRKLQDKNAQIQEHLNYITQQNQSLQSQLEDLSNRFESECAQKNQATRTIQLAELIIDNSPVIVFRRMASEDPNLRKMVYVSQNISHF